MNRKDIALLLVCVAVFIVYYVYQQQTRQETPDKTRNLLPPIPDKSDHGPIDDRLPSMPGWKTIRADGFPYGAMLNCSTPELQTIFTDPLGPQYECTIVIQPGTSLVATISNLVVGQSYQLRGYVKGYESATFVVKLDGGVVLLSMSQMGQKT